MTRRETACMRHHSWCSTGQRFACTCKGPGRSTDKSRRSLLQRSASHMFPSLARMDSCPHRTLDRISEDLRNCRSDFGVYTERSSTLSVVNTAAARRLLRLTPPAVSMHRSHGCLSGSAHPCLPLQCTPADQVLSIHYTLTLHSNTAL